MILIWGDRDDGPVTSVLAKLDPDKTLLVDQSAYARLQGELRLDDGHADGWLRVDCRTIAVEELTGFYLRPYSTAASFDSHRLLDVTVAVDGILLNLAEVLPPTTAVVNKPSAMATNDSKPTQAALIASFGFPVPETIVTTDADVAVAFWEQHGDVIYKSTSGVRSIAKRFTDAHRARLSNIANCPTQFQAFVPGDDHRVHVVGDEVFATRIVSEATDYRYASLTGDERAMTTVTLPNDVATRCITMARALDLLLAGIDLRCTPDGTWYCFEVNTSPAFSWFESHTGQPIATAIASLLGRGHG